MKKILIYSLGFFSTTHLYAAPNDLFLSAIKESQPKFETTFAVNLVNDTVDIFDIREQEGISDKNLGDYKGLQFSGRYNLNSQWMFESSYWYREIEYTQDTNDLHSAIFSAYYTPELNLSKQDNLSIRMSVWGNTANELSKSTPSAINGRTFNQIQIQNPSDLQFQVDTIFSRKIDFLNSINMYASLGYSKVDVEKLNTQTLMSGCLVDINIASNNQYQAKLAEPCPSIQDLDASGDAKDFGLEIDKDLNYDSYYASLGGSWTFRYRQFESQVAYQYQRLWRNDIDDRVSQFGNHPIKDNHSIGAKFSYDLKPTLTTYLQGEIYQHNFVGQIPFLYNGVTASRLEKRYGLASIGLTYRH